MMPDSAVGARSQTTPEDASCRRHAKGAADAAPGWEFLCESVRETYWTGAAVRLAVPDWSVPPGVTHVNEISVPGE